MRLIFHGHWKDWFCRRPRVVMYAVRETVFKSPVFEIEDPDHLKYITSAKIHAKGIVRRKRYIVFGAPDRMIAISTAGFSSLLRWRGLWRVVSVSGDVSQFEETLT